MIERIPALIAAVCLTIYWATVIVKLIRLARKIRKDPNAIPRERVGKLMRILWYPCIFALLAGLWIASATQKHWLIDSTALWWRITVVPASVICVAFTIFTFVCWRKMGRSWRIGIDPNETLTMVVTGPYKYVRHPIYSLRMAINISAIIMAPTPLVLVTAGIDFLLLQIEARREETYMTSKHPEDYANYKKSVGRFIPRMFVG